ncbi:hypothetical protein L3Q82_016357, partial [Scortum barcoo]
MQDNARPHVAGVCQQFLQDYEGIDAMDWPTRSPDLNPIEHIWDIMSRSIHQRHVAPQTVQELADALVQVLLQANLCITCVPVYQQIPVPIYPLVHGIGHQELCWRWEPGVLGVALPVRGPAFVDNFLPSVLAARSCNSSHVLFVSANFASALNAPDITACSPSSARITANHAHHLGLIMIGLSLQAMDAEMVGQMFFPLVCVIA